MLLKVLQALALGCALWAMQTPAAHAEPAPFSNLPADVDVRVIAVCATGVFVIGDVMYAARWTWPPLLWSAFELAFAAVPWTLVAWNDFDPTMDPWAGLLAGAFAAHAITGFVLRADAEGRARKAKLSGPVRRPPSYSRLTPVVLPSSHSVLLGVARAF